MVARETSITEALAAAGAPTDDRTVARLALFAEMLETQGIREGFLGPNEQDRVLPRHVLESVALWPKVGGFGAIVDIGSGAGLPGVVLACMGADVVLVESQTRRAAFLRDVVSRLELTADVRQERAEDVGRAAGSRESFGAATARALAELPVALELCLPLVSIGGRLVVPATPAGQAFNSNCAASDDPRAAGRSRADEPGQSSDAPNPASTDPSARGSSPPRAPLPPRTDGRRAARELSAPPEADPQGTAIGPTSRAPRGPWREGDSPDESTTPHDSLDSPTTPPSVRGAPAPVSIPDLAQVAKLLGGGAPVWEPLTVPGADRPRWVIMVEKVQPTPDRFPRRAGVPRRRPLG